MHCKAYDGTNHFPKAGYLNRLKVEHGDLAYGFALSGRTKTGLNDISSSRLHQAR